MFDHLMTFDEFRLTNRDALHAQREHLRDEAVAENARRETSARILGWVPWDDAYAYATQS